MSSELDKLMEEWKRANPVKSEEQLRREYRQEIGDDTGLTRDEVLSALINKRIADYGYGDIVGVRITDRSSK